MPRILYVSTGTNRGGAEIQAQLLATEMLSRNWDVRMISLIPNGPIATSLERVGIECRSLGMRRGIPSWKALKDLQAQVREFSPDVVHSHMVHANIMARIAVGGGSKWPPLICTVHNIDEGGGWRPWAYRFTDQRAFRTTHVSEIGLTAQRDAGLLSVDRSLCIANAMRFASIAPRVSSLRDPGQPFTWLYVGRLEPVKRVPHLLRCFHQVRQVFPAARLVIVGSGSDEAHLTTHIQAAGLTEAVEMAGSQEDVTPWLQRADGFVSLAEREGMPLTLLEAGSFGLPVVSTDVGGVREIIDGPERGWTVDQSEDGAVSAMLEVMSAPETRRAAIGAALQDHISKRFAPDVIMPRWLDLYQQAISSRA